MAICTFEESDLFNLDDRELKKALKLPLTKPLRYMEKIQEEYRERAVKSFSIKQVYMPSGTASLDITLDDGSTIQILSSFFSEMQKSSFVDDIRKLEDSFSW